MSIRDSAGNAVRTIELVDRGAGLERTAIVGDNRPELYWAVCATQCLGGVPVPLYQDAIEKELGYILDHAEARVAVVEDQEQVDKLLELRAECPQLARLWYDDPRGLRGYSEHGLESLDTLIEAGRALVATQPGWFDEQVAAV